MSSSTYKTVDLYSRLEKKALKRFKEAEDAYREYIHKPIYTGNGILD